MSLTRNLPEYVNACFTGLWITTYEPDEAEREIITLAQEQNWLLASWNIADGIRLINNANDSAVTAAGDPVAALRSLAALSSGDGTALLLLHNFHRFLTSPEVVQTCIQQLQLGKQQRTFVVVLSPLVQIPTELEKLFVVLDHPLPSREQLLSIAEELCADQPDDLPSDEQMARILDAAAGLTRYEAEGAMALSLTRHNCLLPGTIRELKAQTLRKSKILSLHQGEESFSDLGGLHNLKDFCTQALRPGNTVKPRGVLALGVPGVGKSVFARALGNETGRPTLTLDLGSLYGSLVGQTEQNIRQALQVAEATSPCILFADELDKGLSGVGGTGDSGVSTRLFGTLLSWLADHTADVFFFGTANNVKQLPPEFTRAERLDGIFFFDLPNKIEKALIWEQYLQRYRLDPQQQRPSDDVWTGAEIKSCCRLAALLGVPLLEAANNVVPVAVTAAEQIEQLRQWASGRCLSASQSGLYRYQAPTNKPARRLKRDPSTN